MRAGEVGFGGGVGDYCCCYCCWLLCCCDDVGRWSFVRLYLMDGWWLAVVVVVGVIVSVVVAGEYGGWFVGLIAGVAGSWTVAWSTEMVLSWNWSRVMDCSMRWCLSLV